MRGGALPRRAPHGLVGRFFHGDCDRQWQGRVLAEPSPGVFLVELFEWVLGDPNGQVLVRLEDMARWVFYDDADAMKFAYEHGNIQSRWERQRADQ